MKSSERASQNTYYFPEVVSVGVIWKVTNNACGVTKPKKTLECYRYHWDDFLGIRWILEGCQAICYQPFPKKVPWFYEVTLSWADKLDPGRLSTDSFNNQARDNHSPWCKRCTLPQWVFTACTQIVILESLLKGLYATSLFFQVFPWEVVMPTRGP